MQATTRSIALQPGEALAPDRHASTRLFVTEGEVLVQAPAQWLAEALVVSAPRRIVAPAAIACKDIAALAAIGAVKLHIEEPVGLLERWGAAWKAWRPVAAGAPLLSRE
jgi:hypothetical protein